jgi:hypothetical protein
VLPGEYAFVLHTASPFSGARGEMYGELVCGLGETLVGNHPGRPLAFSDRPDGSELQVGWRWLGSAAAEAVGARERYRVKHEA